MKLKNSLITAVVFCTAAIGGMAGIYLTLGRPAAADPKTDLQNLHLQTNQKIEKQKTDLETAALYELAHGCTTTDSFGNKLFCGKSKEKIDALNAALQQEITTNSIRSADEIAQVTANIRNIAENSALEVSFKGNFANPYTEKNEKRIEYYTDASGTVYMVDPDTNTVVSFTNEKAGQSSLGKVLSLEELKQRAETYLQKHVRDFKEIKKTYVYEEGSKGGTTFVFRWNARTKLNGEDSLPFVMVKLAADGQIIGFSDTRSLYVQN